MLPVVGFISIMIIVIDSKLSEDRDTSYLVHALLPDLTWCLAKSRSLIYVLSKWRELTSEALFSHLWEELIFTERLLCVKLVNLVYMDYSVFLLTPVIWGKYCFYLRFSDEETEAQRVQ